MKKKIGVKLQDKGSYVKMRKLREDVLRETGKVVRAYSDAERPDDELLSAYERLIEASASGEDPFEGFKDGVLEWEVDCAEDEDEKDPSCGSYVLKVVPSKEASLAERGYGVLSCDLGDLRALKMMAKQDLRTARSFFKIMVEEELKRRMPMQEAK